MLKLSSRWAAKGLAYDDIVSALNALLDQGGSGRNADGVDLHSRVEPLARSAVQKFGHRDAPAPGPVETPIPGAKPNGQAKVQPHAPPSGIHATWAREYDVLTPPRFVIGNLIESGSLVLIYGESNTGKSTFAIDLALTCCRASRGADDVPTSPSPPTCPSKAPGASASACAPKSSTTTSPRTSPSPTSPAASIFARRQHPLPHRSPAGDARALP